MQTNRPESKTGCRGLTVVELLVAITIMSILIALLLPAVQQAREAARRASCANHLKQLGLGMHLYSRSHGCFPPGYTAELSQDQYVKSWAWGAFLLPYLEKQPLYDTINLEKQSLSEAVVDPNNIRFYQTELSVYLCPSDSSHSLSHSYRQLLVPQYLSQTNPEPMKDLNNDVSSEYTWVFLTPSVVRGFSGISVIAHVNHPIPFPIPKPKPKPKPFPFPFPDPDPDPIDDTEPETTPDPPPVASMPVQIGKSNYIGSLGSTWKPKQSDWSDEDFKGNGMLGRNTRVTWHQITDGTSNTFVLGERSWKNYAAVWPGVNSVNDCGFIDNQMVLGTAFYPLNQRSVSVNIDCDGTGSANFSSHHPGGANFLFADGSVHFLSDKIDFRNSDTPHQSGLFQRLSHRSDGGVTGEF